MTRQLPAAAVTVDHWHLIRLANLMVTAVRQRVARGQLGRRGHKQDLALAHRMLLLRAGGRLSPRALHRLGQVLWHDDPTGEIGAACGVKEQLRMLLATTDLAAAKDARMRLGVTVLAADIDETWTLWNTLNAWCPETEVFIATRVTNARTEAANTSIKQIKRTGRGYRKPRPLPGQYPPTQRPANTLAPTLDSASHHDQLRIASIVVGSKYSPLVTTATIPDRECEDWPN